MKRNRGTKNKIKKLYKISIKMELRVYRSLIGATFNAPLKEERQFDKYSQWEEHVKTLCNQIKPQDLQDFSHLLKHLERTTYVSEWYYIVLWGCLTSGIAASVDLFSKGSSLHIAIYISLLVVLSIVLCALSLISGNDVIIERSFYIDYQSVIKKILDEK